MKILILGDVHGCFEDVNIVVARALKLHPDISAFVQVGDWGDGWTGERKKFRFHDQYHETLPLQPFHVIEGNHDNYDLLKEKGGFDNPRTVYQSRGSVADLGEAFGRAMFFGGASSIDKGQRIEGHSWWPDESIKYIQILSALEKEGPINAIFSHEHPLAFPYRSYKDDFGKADKQALDALRQQFKPRFWFFGHHHDFKQGETEGTKWACAPCIEHRQALLWDGEDIQLLNFHKRTASYFDQNL